jgi:hypothetical protein
MRIIVLLMCGKNKLPYKALTKDIYTSSRFQKSIEYAKTITDYSSVYVLSAKYSLLKLDDEIAPYDLSIYEMSLQDKKEWAEKVITLLETVSDTKRDKYIFLTDDFYSEYLLPFLTDIELPLKGIPQEKHIDFFIHKLSISEVS